MAGVVAIGAAVAGTVASTVIGANSAKKAERRARSDKNRLIDELEELENTIANKKFYTRAIETINDLSNHYYPGKEDGVAFETIKKITFSLEVKTTKTTTMEMMSKQKNFEFNIYIFRGFI